MGDLCYYHSMENFFKSNSKPAEIPLTSQYDDIKTKYSKIFMEAANDIRSEIYKFKPVNPCDSCKVSDCKLKNVKSENDIFLSYPKGCAYKDWQAQILTFLNGDYFRKMKSKYDEVMNISAYSCSRCGECCRLAVSEYSYTQLKQRAMRGDKYSEEFVSVFVPFESEEDAKKVNPEYFKMLNELVEDKTYYYYCPKLNGNECSDYENRPNICKNFPQNPLKLLPAKCSYNNWKCAVSHDAMFLQAQKDLLAYYKERLS